MKFIINDELLLINSLENVAASSFNNLSSFLNFIIVSDTMFFSFSYFPLRLVRATSAVFLFDFNTVRRVAICSRLVDNKLLSLITCSCNSAISSLFSPLLPERKKKTDKIRNNHYLKMDLVED